MKIREGKLFQNESGKKMYRACKYVPKGCSRAKRVCVSCMKNIIHKNSKNYESKICKECETSLRSLPRSRLASSCPSTVIEGKALGQPIQRISRGRQMGKTAEYEAAWNKMMLDALKK